MKRVIPWMAPLLLVGCGEALVEFPRGDLDASSPDASSPDAAVSDAATPDGALPDGALLDGALPDGALSDGAPSDCGPADCELVACDGLSCGAGCVCEGGDAVETVCDDGIDNDEDGLTDCEDPDCFEETCNDGDLCTSGTVCTAEGSCEGEATVCFAPEESCLVAIGVCDPDTGDCVHETRPPGTACSTDPCNLGTCDGDGVCVTSPVVCADPDLCASGPGTCDPVAGGCVYPVHPAGTVCREAVGACDIAEECDGASLTCPADELHGGDVVCHPAACSGLPDTFCPGDSPLCPAPPESCGCEDQLCCADAPACGDDLACVDGSCSCGARDEPCCGGNSCDGTLTCNNGTCRRCFVFNEFVVCLP